MEHGSDPAIALARDRALAEDGTILDGHHRVKILRDRGLDVDGLPREDHFADASAVMPMNPELYWIEGPWRGKLAISGRPRGGDWLEDEVQGWKDAHIDTVVSFLTADEERALGLEQEARVAKLKRVSFISFPVPDRSVPDDFGKSVELIRTLEEQLAGGKSVALHCRQGIGRSAVFAAALLVSAGVEPDKAFARLRAARGCAVPETAEQRDWVIRLSRELTAVQR